MDGLPLGEVAQLDEETAQFALAQRVVCMRGKNGVLDNTFFKFLLMSSTQQKKLSSYATGTTVAGISQKTLRSVPILIPSFSEQFAIGKLLGTFDDKIELNRRMNETLETMARAIFKDWFVDFGPTRARAEGRAPYLAPDLWSLFPDRLDDDDKPEGWQKTTLVALTSKIGSGATPKGGKGVYVNEGIYFIRSQNVHDYRFVWSGIVKICDEDAYRLRGVSVDKGDVLINITGDSILRTCVVDPGVLPARVNQHVAIIRARENIPARFLHLYLVQPSSKALLLGNDAGGSHPAITKGHLEAFPIILPTPQLLHVFGNITAPLFDLSEQNEAENRTLAQTRDLMLHKLMSGEIRLRTAEKIVGEVA